MGREYTSSSALCFGRQHGYLFSFKKLGIMSTFYIAADKQQARQYLSRLMEAVRDSVPSGTQLKNTSKAPMACE